MIYTAPEVKEMLERQRREIERRQEQIEKITVPLDVALSIIDIEKDCIFSSLLFVDSPTWKSGLKLLQDQFNSKVTAGQQAIQTAITSLPTNMPADLKSALKSLINSFENPTVDMASQINEAINTAIGGNDGGVALRKLAEERLPDIARTLRQRIGEIQTDQFAKDRRFSRAKVFIGLQCNALEKRDRIKSIRAQWKALYRQLRANQSHLTEDALAAWEYFEEWKPTEMTRDQLRRFEQEISRFKQEMQHLADGA